MGLPALTLLSLSTLSLVTSYHVPYYELEPPVQKHLPPLGQPTFQRNSVEGYTKYSAQLSANNVFGSGSLPLRDAVEAPPDFSDLKSQALKNERVPLRDAVEHRPPPPLGINTISHESIWLEQLSPPIIRRNNQDRGASAKVVCYYDSSAVNTDEPFAFNPQGIPIRKCTHIVYNAVTIDSNKFTVIPVNRGDHHDIKGGYKAATDLKKKNPSTQIFVSIISPINDNNYFYNKLFNNNTKYQQQLSQSILIFLDNHNFDGIEINFSNINDTQLKLLLKCLYIPLTSKGYKLAVAIVPNNEADPQISDLADLLLFRAWQQNLQNVTSHIASLKFVSNFVEKWLTAGANPNKIILGLPLFGQTYTLKYSNSTDVGSPVKGPGIEGIYTKRPGILAFYEICDKLADLWTSGRDEDGAYLKRGDQWITYDDTISFKIKITYAVESNLGGVGLYNLAFDDFVGICGESWPMLNAANKFLGINDTSVGICRKDGVFRNPDDCSGYLICEKKKLYSGTCAKGLYYDPMKNKCVNTNPEVCHPKLLEKLTQESDYLSQLKWKQRSQPLRIREVNPKIVCYITSWALYRKEGGKFVPEHLDTRLCTHIIYAFAGLNPDTLTIQSFDPWADIENGLYNRVTSTKDAKVLLAIGGWADSTGDKYSRLVSNPSARKTFITSVISFLNKYKFDGLSFEWNYPKCWQSDCNKGPDSDRPNLTKLIEEMRREFDQTEPELTLAMSLSGYREIIDVAYDVRKLSEAVDFFSVMTYDYHGAWESETGHVSPLYSSPSDANPFYNVNSTMNYLLSYGADRSKLIPGIPFYGQSYRLAIPQRSKLGDPSAGPGTPGEFTKQPGMLAYYEICDNIKNKDWKAGPGPSAFNKNQFVGYDNPRSISEKGAWIVDNNFGGAAVWTVDLDDFTNRCCLEPFPLLRSLNRALGRLLTGAPSGGNCEKPSEPVTPLAPTLTTHSDANEGMPRPTRPMSSSTTFKPTTWPTWTEKPTTTTTWPTWTWIPSSTSRATTSTTTTVRAPTQWTTTKKPDEMEPTESETSCQSGEFRPDPNSCQRYYRCILGELRQEKCTYGLHWNKFKNRCDWPNNSKCLSSESQTTYRPITRPSTSTTPVPSTFPTYTSTVSTLTKCHHGNFYPHPELCSQYYLCVNDNLIIQHCAPGLTWSQEKSMCDWPWKNPCKDKIRKNPLQQLSSKQNEPCIPGSFTDVPGECHKYRQCLWGRHETYFCAPGLHFNKDTKICDWPNRARCESNVPSEVQPTIGTPMTTVFPVTEPPTLPPTKPSKKPTGFITRPTNKPTTTTSAPSWTEAPWSPVPVLPPPKVDPSKVSPLSGYFKVVCYFTNWAWYRRGVGKYVPEEIDHTLCTHIVYGFAVLDYSELTIRAHDSWADYDNRYYDRVVQYKARGLKVLIALGGWNDSAGDKYSRLVNSPAARKKFIAHVIAFIEKYKFDGLDLDWEYPVCWQVNCDKGPASDKESFAALLRELSAEFKPRGLLLSAAVSPSKTVIDKGYDVPALAKYLDWISVMAYDYHGQWDKKTGHVAPLYYREDDDFYFFNANYSINYWISKGAPPRSIVMGMPMYGQSFTINDPHASTGLNAPASGGAEGEFTRASGFLAYYEICDRIKNRGWTVVQDPQKRIGPYAYKGNQWVSFDDADMIRLKSQFIRDMGLGGGMIWALDLDDFKNRCGEGAHPLLHTIQIVLSEPPNQFDRPIKPPAIGEDLEWKLPSQTTLMIPIKTDSVATIDEVEKEEEYKVVCYFTNWAWYRQEGGKFLPEDIDADLCTHIIYGFAVLDRSTLTIKPHDSWADIDNKFYERVVAYKAKGKKVLVAIGGWNDSAGDKYSKLVNSPTARSRFINHVVKFIEKYNFDGLDLDWEYPVCWQVDCNAGPKSDKQGFSMFVKELSETFKPRKLLLSSAVSPSKRVIDAGYDVPVLSQYLDWISVMTYDFHGQWDKKTGHVAPLYERPDDWEPTFNANFSMNYWISQGASPKKLIMGVPLYGQSFSLAERSVHGLNAATYGGGEAGENTRSRGFLSYYEICQRVMKNGWTVVQDPKRRIGPYAYLGDQWVSFDDAEQVRLKAELIKSLQLGGGMVWALDLDDFKNWCGCEPSPLLRTLNRVLRNYPAGPNCTVGFSKPESAPPSAPSVIPISETTPTSGEELTTPTYLPPVAETEDSVEVIANPPPPPSIPIGECARQFKPHEEDCNKYIVCNFGQLSEMACPDNLYWNEDHCDWPENVQCKTNTSPETSVAEIVQKPPPKPTIPNEIDGPSGSVKKIICYFTNWALYRPGNGRYVPEDINSNLCTHIIYGFTVLDPATLTITLHDKEADIDNNFFGRITAFKSKGIKVLVAIGGWNDSEGDKYSRLVNNPAARKQFINHAVAFIEDNNFDGLDLDWEYPVCWQVDCDRGRASDKRSFSLFVQELSAAFKPKGLLLSAAVSPSKRVIDAGYEVAILGKYLDWISVMTYDFHGNWDHKTGHVAPLDYFPCDEYDYFNANFSMRYWMSRGAPASKLIMGIPLYGQSFTLADKNQKGLQAPTVGPGINGTFTKQAGFLSFYEICSKVKTDNWEVVKDPERRIGSYAVQEDQWVSYDDVTNVLSKAAFIRKMNLAGGMIWALDLDDFTGKCGCGKYPLLSALNRGLKGSFNGQDCT